MPSVVGLLGERDRGARPAVAERGGYQRQRGGSQDCGERTLQGTGSDEGADVRCGAARSGAGSSWRVAAS